MVLEFAAEAATWTVNAAGMYLCIPANTPAKVLAQLEPGKTYTAEIKVKRQKRSLDANAYYWKLVGELSKALNLTPEVIYRQHIAEMGNYETICMKKEAYELFARVWCNGHLGRTTKTKESKLDGCITVLAYYGSSDFDTAQMSHLIDNCIQDCKAIGIETKSPEEVESLLAQWDAQTHQGAANTQGG